MPLTLTSPAFKDGGPMPRRFTCEGEDISPPLDWAGLPSGTKSLALIVDDPDAPNPKAPRMVYVHWVLYNLPSDLHGLPENAARSGLPPGTVVALNDWKRPGYGGPCPPIGRHRYFHKLYALDTMLSRLETPTKSGLEAAMKGHILAEAALLGTYQKEG
ncbi:MAG: YbhB/YbcL family Raf kinase inhibitor-like protein [Hyphomicrobium sp.]|jgi:hypothetical protein